MSRLRPNCSVMRVEPTVLIEVISETSAIWPRCRSSGPATVAATSAGLAPGKVACTAMVGMSTSGSGETGSLKKATVPATTSPSDSSVVATGRRMNGVERLMLQSAKPALPGSSPCPALRFAEHAPEDGVDVFQVIAEVELLLDLGVGEELLHVGVLLQ